MEMKVSRLLELLVNVLRDTRGRVEKKASQTYEEMLAEMEEVEAEDAAVAEDDEEEEYVYNPLKLPLGWDGKPIPYWLYKLHGLNQEFKCEICGNYRWDGWAGPSVRVPAHNRLKTTVSATPFPHAALQLLRNLLSCNIVT